MKANHTVIIAEAGVNHNGDLNLAKQLILVAAETGADFVKFQTFKADKIVSQTARKADYQIKNIQDGDDSQYDMLKKLEMPEEWHYELIEYARAQNIAFLSTGFDEDSIDFLDRIGCPFFKIPSGEITNKPYLEHIARKGKPVIISTGMADLSEVKEVVNIFLTNGLSKSNITVLHCNTEYPTPFEDVNLLAMHTMNRELGVAFGYSDHTEGIEVPVAAVALGAVVIEKHFTLHKNMKGPDHKASLEPHELKAMVNAIRNIEKAVSGNGLKVPSPSEAKNKDNIRKSLYFNQALPKGTIITPMHLIALRPGNGISPMNIGSITGRSLKQDVDFFEQVKTNVFE
jgi:N-acetylneuraminate synthase/N,N'-diacetyllegionaminate synthase